jgi:hypothetical protein
LRKKTEQCFLNFFLNQVIYQRKFSNSVGVDVGRRLVDGVVDCVRIVVGVDVGRRKLVDGVDGVGVVGVGVDVGRRKLVDGVDGVGVVEDDVVAITLFILFQIFVHIFFVLH